MPRKFQVIARSGTNTPVSLEFIRERLCLKHPFEATLHHSGTRKEADKKKKKKNCMHAHVKRYILMCATNQARNTSQKSNSRATFSALVRTQA